MKFISTRDEKILENKGNFTSASQAIIKGMAPDRGLYVPTFIPKIDFDLLKACDFTYKELAKKVISYFFGDLGDEELSLCIEKAYTKKFSADDIVPVFSADEAFFLELYHGPTAAFKDIALSILPHLLTVSLKKEKEDKKILILTATSGDTGKAALCGFADVVGTEIMVFFPKDGVSMVQERQMTSQEGKNTYVYAINGNFDDAQTAVKNIFTDALFAKELMEQGFKLSSANSINIGRLIPQIVYYFYGYIRLLRDRKIDFGEQINIAVPTGNFGNILAAYYAKEMGLPVDKLICASNKNKVLADFIRSGVYNIKRNFSVTNSPSMDIIVSSNLERLLYHLCDNDPKEINRLMGDLDTQKSYTVNEKIRQSLTSFYGGFADEKETLSTIKKVYDKYNYLIDTHTAVAYKVWEDYKEETKDNKKTLVASTASPYKFAESVLLALGMEAEKDGFDAVRALEKMTGVNIPSCLTDLEKKRVIHERIADKDELKNQIKKSLNLI